MYKECDGGYGTLFPDMGRYASVMDKGDESGSVVYTGEVVWWRSIESTDGVWTIWLEDKNGQEVLEYLRNRVGCASCLLLFRCKLARKLTRVQVCRLNC